MFLHKLFTNINPIFDAFFDTLLKTFMLHNCLSLFYLFVIDKMFFTDLKKEEALYSTVGIFMYVHRLLDLSQLWMDFENVFCFLVPS